MNNNLELIEAPLKFPDLALEFNTAYLHVGKEVRGGWDITFPR